MNAITATERSMSQLTMTGGTGPGQWTAAQYIVQQLTAWGVKRIYGVIGDATLELLNELARQQSIQYVACRHECSAALMASAEAKLTGQAGVCLATSGPGITNLLNGLGDAAMDGAGVLAITGQVDTTKIGTKEKQYIDQQTLVRPIASSTALATHPDALPELMQQAYVEARSGKVAHLSIPRDLYAQPVNGAILPYGDHFNQKLVTPDSVIADVAAMLMRAERPVFIIGRGGFGVEEPLLALSEQLGAAAVTTLPARALFPNDHDLYAGGLGQAGSEAATRLLEEGDLIVTFGATWWPDDYTPNTAPLVQIDRCAANIGSGKSVMIGVVGDLADVVPKLVRMTDQDPLDRTAWAERIRQLSAAWNERISSEASSDGTPIPPQRVMQAISNWANDDAVITVDTGDHTLWFNRIFQAKRNPVAVSGRWRTLGFALPAAIAAQLIHPDREVIAIAGDGGVVQTLMEFSTAVELALPIVVIVINNGCYAMEKNRMMTAGWLPLGSGLRNPDFAAIAEACGGTGFRAAAPHELEDALQRAKQRQGPVLIDVHTSDRAVPHTKV